METAKSYFYHTLIAILLLGTSCSQKFYYQSAYVDNDIPEFQTKVSNDVHIQTRFGGDAINYLVFEIDIENQSSQDIPISIDDIKLHIVDSDYPENTTLRPINKEDLIFELEQEFRNLKRSKRANNAANILGVGLSILSVAITPNSDALSTIVYAADATGYIIEDNRSYALSEGDIETQIAYTDEWVLDSATLPPGAKISYDIVFPTVLLNGDGQLTIESEYLDYSQKYTFEIMEARMD